MSLQQARIKHLTPLVLSEWKIAADERRFNDIPKPVRPYYSPDDQPDAQKIDYNFVRAYAQIIAKTRADQMPPEQEESTAMKITKGTVKAAGLLAVIGFRAGSGKWWR